MALFALVNLIVAEGAHVVNGWVPGNCRLDAQQAPLCGSLFLASFELLKNSLPLIFPVAAVFFFGDGVVPRL